MIDIDAKDLSQEVTQVLRAVARIIAGAAIAHPDVEVAIGPKRQHSAVVVFEWLRNDEQYGFGGTRLVRIRWRDAIFGDNRRAVRASCVIDIKASVGREERMKRKSQQTAFSSVNHAVRDVEKEVGDIRAGRHYSDAACLFDDEPAVRTVRGI